MSDDVLQILANLIRYGTVETVDVASKRVTVKTGGVTTRPLPWITARAGRVRSWMPPSKGEQVIVLSPNGDLAAGVAIGGLFSNAMDKPADATADNVLMVFGDGAVLLYDAATQYLKAALPKGGTVQIDAPGGVRITGSLHVTENISSGNGASGSFTTPLGAVVSVAGGQVIDIF